MALSQRTRRFVVWLQLFAVRGQRWAGAAV